MDTDDAGMGTDTSDADRTIVGMASTPATSNATKRAPDSAGLQQLRGEVRALKRTMEARFDEDLYFFAKHEEAADTIKNEKNLDKVIFKGVPIQNLEGKMDVKKPIIIKALEGILDAILDLEEGPDGTKVYPKILFVSHLNGQIKTPRRVIEAKFESKDVAGKIRTAFAEKRKRLKAGGVLPDALKGIGVHLCLTRDTTIRIEILKALAKIVSDNTNREVNSYVLEFLPRPLMKVVITKSEHDVTTRVFGFTEAIRFVKESYPIHDQDLIEAYSKAGNSRNLAHKFVILKEGPTRNDNQDRDEQNSRGSKRPKT